MLAPCAAQAAGLPEEPSAFSVMAGFLQMLASLGIVIGLIFVVRRLLSHFQNGGAGRGTAPRHVRVVESRFLGPKKSLILVEVGGEYLLLGSTGEGINLIKQIDMIENIEVIEDLSVGGKPSRPWWEAARSLAVNVGRHGALRGPLQRRAG
jgi:flagellar protein FliO/FliZ